MTEEKCADDHSERRIIIRRCCTGLLIFTFTILVIILLIWAILQPKKPHFTLQDATIFSLNVSSPNIISSSIQVTINSRNPNSRIGIYYEKMEVYATYHNQQITYYTVIPPVYQGHKDINIWSPFVYGSNVPVAPYNGVALSQDKSNGAIWLIIKINGRVKWRVGSFVSGRYHLHVTCPAYIPLGYSRNTGIVVGNAIKYQLSQTCSVSV
ncbi:NDR1/HIN1-like protein 1 [Olea europaea var. sylvestris]|uniref:NDR1 HIN1 1 n=1 Tax=Olea europaea subsp. europaea TaxID=158383 RepID=A0A8S0UWI3_OLEEU|nr:NDR1/HIN1-like protein 1 [Olea europaea var. sylvestris]CAA3025096.1 NDR1 HIN1 1 [Olea europaea subsp. europaea]